VLGSAYPAVVVANWAFVGEHRRECLMQDLLTDRLDHDCISSRDLADGRSKHILNVTFFFDFVPQAGLPQ